MLLSTPCLWLCDPPWPASLSSLQPSLFDFLQLVLEGPLGPVLGPRRGGLAGQGDPSGHCGHVFWKIQFSSKNTVVATNRGNIFIGFCLVTLEIYRVFIRIVGDWFVSWLVGFRVSSLYTGAKYFREKTLLVNRICTPRFLTHIGSYIRSDNLGSWYTTMKLSDWKRRKYHHQFRNERMDYDKVRLNLMNMFCSELHKSQNNSTKSSGIMFFKRC